MTYSRLNRVRWVIVSVLLGFHKYIVVGLLWLLAFRLGFQFFVERTGTFFV